MDSAVPEGRDSPPTDARRRQPHELFTSAYFVLPRSRGSSWDPLLRVDGAAPGAGCGLRGSKGRRGAGERVTDAPTDRPAPLSDHRSKVAGEALYEERGSVHP